jgi:hypothetical protein
MHHGTAKETTKLIKEIQTSVKQSKPMVCFLNLAFNKYISEISHSTA